MHWMAERTLLLSTLLRGLLLVISRGQTGLSIGKEMRVEESDVKVPTAPEFVGCDIKSEISTKMASPVIGCRLDSTQTSLQTSVRRLAAKSLVPFGRRKRTLKRT